MCEAPLLTHRPPLEKKLNFTLGNVKKLYDLTVKRSFFQGVKTTCGRPSMNNMLPVKFTQ